MWARNAAYSTPRDFASLVSRRTSRPSLRKFGKTWRKGSFHQRGQRACPLLGHECSRLPGLQQCPAALHGLLGQLASVAWVWDGAELGAAVQAISRLEEVAAQPVAATGPGAMQRRHPKGRPQGGHPVHRRRAGPQGMNRGTPRPGLLALSLSAGAGRSAFLWHHPLACARLTHG